MKNEKKKQNFHVMKIQVYGSIIGGGLVIACNTQLPLGLDYLNLVWVWHGYVCVRIIVLFSGLVGKEGSS